jgi:hypothetical protein
VREGRGEEEGEMKDRRGMHVSCSVREGRRGRGLDEGWRRDACELLSEGGEERKRVR